MRSPRSLTQGGPSSLQLRIPTPPHHFHSTVSLEKLKRVNYLVLVCRMASFCFSFSSSVFMLTNSRGAESPRWSDFDAFRFVFAGNATVAVYSLFETVAAVWEISRGATLFPETLQVWFDFGHDQVFSYLLLSAGSAGTTVARTLQETATCSAAKSFCVQTDIAIFLGFGGFLFLGLSTLLSGFRFVCFIIYGSRFHV